MVATASIALRANHEGMKEFVERTTASGRITVTSDESYGPLLMAQ